MAVMANPEHLELLQKGVGVWNAWRTENQAIAPNFSSANLSEANLIMADFRGANLSKANLRKADLSEANLSDAHLTEADLSEADFSEVNFRGADLSEVNLREANLIGANLSEASLIGADLSEAVIYITTFANLDLSKTKGLERCVHLGPSSIGINTLFKSQGNIPDIFLRECGVPEQFITYARSLVTNPIEFYSCFISYSSHDQAFAERLHADLRGKNLRCWFAPEDLKTGDRFQERIEESIRLFDKVMIVLSDASVKSRWVEREVNAAREREDRENRTVLFPIRIDDAVMKAPQPWAADIRRCRHIGDFCEWKTNASYQKAFQRLLRDLEAKQRLSL